ncbi:MAG TPA: methyltransferase domain-containing protein [Galbitalea sp.]
MAHDEHRHNVPAAADQPFDWDERYASAEQLWSGEPNPALVEAATSRAPGRAVDVGCGEGADAVWLAEQGWDVTALDVSAVALERAARHAQDAGVSVHWIHAGLLDAGLEAGDFDLVSVQYPVLLKTADAAAEHTLMDSVALGGILVIVHHADFHVDERLPSGLNPADFVGPWDVAPLLGNGWRIDVYENRPRTLTAGAGAHHTEDVVLIARRVH